MTPLDVIGIGAAAIYGLAISLLALYAAHGLWLLWLFARHESGSRSSEVGEASVVLPADDDLPVVLVQLPIFNERDVIDRILESASQLDWPASKLVIQLLDDSTDDTVALARSKVARLAAGGLNIVHVHRKDRTGFKAGALQLGMAESDAEFVAIFDADFIPRPDFLRRAIVPLLADKGLALVQGRWAHLNRTQNLLTQVQAIGIDGHFAIEQGARAWSGLAMNFNGTCGLWRRSAIDHAGGWQHDTLTEDLDLSYRAQLKGWRCTYRMGLDVPGELPADIASWRSQQFRWAKGSQQTARKLAWPILRSGWSVRHKIASLLHLTHYAVHPLMLLSLLAAPVAILLCPTPPSWLLLVGFVFFLGGMFAPLATYAVGEFVLHGQSGIRSLRFLPMLAAVGTGIAISNTRAVVEAWRGIVSPFVRTPKNGASAGSYRATAASGSAELLCSTWAALGIVATVAHGRWWVAPLLLIYSSGFLTVGLLLWRQHNQQRL